MKHIILIFLFTVSASLSTQAKEAELQIICTIKPLCLLVKAVAGEHAEITQLLPDNADLHHYSFRPSDLRKLSRAMVIVRASAELERFLAPLLETLPQPIITLGEADGLVHLAMPLSHHHAHESEEEHAVHHNDKKEEEHDPHFWMSPLNAEKIALYLAAELTKINPAQAETYQKNSQMLIQQIKQNDQTIRKLLENDQHKPYLTFHSGLQYFEKHYGLEGPEIISLHEGLPPGIKTILRIRKQIKKTGIRCLITQPQASEALVKTLAEGMNLTVVTLAAVGSTLPQEEDGYTGLLLHSAKQLHHCLKKSLDSHGIHAHFRG